MPDPVIPRWEWRSFGQVFGNVDEYFSKLRPEKTQLSDEVYWLARKSDANVKIRNELLDIKVLEQTNPQGLQQWRPVLKAEFPLTPADTENLCRALGIEPFSFTGPHTREGVEKELTATSKIQIFRVSKKRAQYKLENCTAELARLNINGQNLRTLALESEDSERVMAALRELRLDPSKNSSYPQLLLRLQDASLTTKIPPTA